MTLVADLEQIAEARHAFCFLLLSDKDPPTTLEALVGPRPAWEGQAASRGMGSDVNFFPERGEPTTAAKAVCSRCPVREPCLALALDGAEGGAIPGIWGGTSALERRKLRRASA